MGIASSSNAPRRWGVLGVPSSAGGHTPGMDLAPGALRIAGLLEALAGSGAEVVDHGDTAGFRRVPDRAHPDRQNVGAVTEVARDVAGAVSSIVRVGETPLVIGGDCTVTVGVVAGMQLGGADPALLYFDGGPDLYTPGRIAYGNLDAMGLAHMLALPGSDPGLVRAGARIPLLRTDQVVLYGDAVPDDLSDHEFSLLQQLAITRIAAAQVHGGPEAAAWRARTAIESAGECFVVHFDVDVLGHLHMPLANMPNPDAPPWGPDVDEVVTSLQTFVASRQFAGMVLTEVNPNNAPDDRSLLEYVQMIMEGLSDTVDPPGLRTVAD